MANHRSIDRRLAYVDANRHYRHVGRKTLSDLAIPFPSCSAEQPIRSGRKYLDQLQDDEWSSVMVGFQPPQIRVEMKHIRWQLETLMHHLRNSQSHFHRDFHGLSRYRVDDIRFKPKRLLRVHGTNRLEATRRTTYDASKRTEVLPEAVLTDASNDRTVLTYVCDHFELHSNLDLCFT